VLPLIAPPLEGGLCDDGSVGGADYVVSREKNGTQTDYNVCPTGRSSGQREAWPN
jgi:hypothetical protein